MTMAWGKHRTEHGGPKHGKGPDRKAWVKRASRKQRRAKDRGVVSDFPPIQGTGAGTSLRKTPDCAPAFGGRP